MAMITNDNYRVISRVIKLYEKKVTDISLIQHNDTIFVLEIFGRDRTPFTIEDVILNTVRGDNTLIVQETGITVNGNTLTIVLDPRIVDIPGDVTFELVFIDNGITISTYKFGARVNAMLVNGQSTSPPASEIIDRIAAMSNTPYVDPVTLTWRQWSNDKQVFVDTGVPAQGGDIGIDGRTPELRVSGGYIQWRYIGDTAWINLIALSELEGADGIDGKSTELQVANNYIQWRQTGGAWNNLISLDSLKGDKGDNGDTGDKGTGLDYNWNGTSLGIKREDEANYAYVDLKGEPGSGGGVGDVSTVTSETADSFTIQQDPNDTSFYGMKIYGNITPVVNPTVTVSGINLFNVLSAEWYNTALLANRPILQALSTYVVSKTAEKVQIRHATEYYSGAGAIIQLVPGATYYMSNVFENTGVAADQYIKAGFYANRTDVNDSAKCVLTASLENNGSFTVPATAPYMVIGYILADETTAVKTAEIREIFLTRGAETKPYTPYIGKQTVTLNGITLNDGDYIGMTDGTVKSVIGGATTDITNTVNGQLLLGLHGYAATDGGTMIQFSNGAAGNVAYNRSVDAALAEMTAALSAMIEGIMI